MKNRIGFFLVFFLISSVLSAEEFIRHPFYVSIIQIDYNQEKNSFEATFKIFTDDLENTIKNQAGVKKDFEMNSNNANANQLIRAYLQRHFELFINEQKQTGDYLGFESDFDVTKIYVEWKSLPDSINSVKVFSDLLIAELPTQSNIIHLDYQNETMSLILNSNNKEGKIILKQ